MTTSRSEDTLYSSLTDVDALEKIFQIGLNLKAVPTPPMREVVQWALDYFDRSGQRQAPSREALMETWREVIEDAEVTIVEVDVELDDVSWAIDALHAHFALYEFQNGNRGLNSLAGRLLGSVPANISHRAACDVLIVHTTSGRAR